MCGAMSPSRGMAELARLVHATYPHSGCAIALEVKKFYMDEWTGVPHRAEIGTLQRLFAALVPALEAAVAGPIESAGGASA